MYVDVKVQVWQRIQLNESEDLGPAHKREIVNLLKEKRINDLWNLKYCDPDTETLLETEEYMTPQENDNCETIEFFEDADTKIWDNNPLAPSTFFEGIDWDALREQKQVLMDTMDEIAKVPPSELSKHMTVQLRKLDGIVHLIDSIQDYAVDALYMSEKKVFGEDWNNEN